ncbi:MAG: hypothetical protein OEW42_20245 [Acidimicrobiia bacterium]|nr:hypothetical protein [Acidimicrobiia bacterium]
MTERSNGSGANWSGVVKMPSRGSFENGASKMPMAPTKSMLQALAQMVSGPMSDATHCPTMRSAPMSEATHWVPKRANAASVGRSEPVMVIWSPSTMPQS